MYKYLRGEGKIWVDSVPPPKETTNVLWLKFPEEFGIGEDNRFVRFEINPETGELFMILKYDEVPGEEWIPISDITTKGFELLVFVHNQGTNQGEWYPIQGTRGKRGPSGVVVSDVEPEDPEVQIWVDTSSESGNTLQLEDDMLNSTDNPVTQRAIKNWVLALLETQNPPNPNNPIIL